MVKHFVQTGKKRFCLTNERNSTILILTGAPSPSGKAGDFDSPIVGSTPAGATKSPVILKRLTGLFASLFHKMRLNGAKLSGGGSFWWACGGSSCSKGPTQSR